MVSYRHSMYVLDKKILNDCNLTLNKCVCLLRHVLNNITLFCLKLIGARFSFKYHFYFIKKLEFSNIYGCQKEILERKNIEVVCFTNVYYCMQTYTLWLCSRGHYFNIHITLGTKHVSCTCRLHIAITSEMWK